MTASDAWNAREERSEIRAQTSFDVENQKTRDW